jgi:nitrile hydratase subunit alpha
VGKNHPSVDDYVASRVRALESLLLEKGLLAPAAVDRVVQRYESDTGPMIGRRAVARAWLDDDYRRRLLTETTAALADLGLQFDRLVVVENTPTVHNLVVCSLCSCYPWSVLGLPPKWYTSPEYRARAVSEPRRVLKEFGLVIPEERQIQVWDSSAELRYMVLPARPDGAERFSADELARMINRDALVGTAEVALPVPRD